MTPDSLQEMTAQKVFKVLCLAILVWVNQL